MTHLFTVGHGTLAIRDLRDLLASQHVTALVDVRAHPGSRRNPQHRREELEEWCPGAGLTYRWDPRLGGRRRPQPTSRHVALQHPSFRAYADHMGSTEFLGAVADLIDEARRGATAVMCSETLWWRCHRRLIADHVALVHDVDVEHLMWGRPSSPHRPTAGARIDGDRVTYDVIDS